MKISKSVAVILAALNVVTIATRADAAPAVATEPSQTRSAKAVKQPAKAVLDPTVIDPVARLSQISSQVKASRVELSAIAGELDKLMAELDKMEGKPAKDIDRAHFAQLEKRFKSALTRSEAVEKKVGQSLAGNLKDIDNIRNVLKKIQVERAKNSGAKKVLSDAELKECLKDLNDLDATVRELLKNLNDKS